MPVNSWFVRTYSCSAVHLCLCSGLAGRRTSNHLAKDSVLVVQMAGALVENEELGPIRVSARVGHAEHTTAGVRESGVQLILEGGSVDGLPSSACSCGIPSLQTAALSGSMKRGKLQHVKLWYSMYAQYAQMHKWTGLNP